MSTNKHALKIFLILLSVFLIASSCISCIKIIREGEQEPPGQSEDNSGAKSLISIVKTIIEKVKGISIDKETGLGKLPIPGQSTPNTRPHPPVRTGEIALGPPVAIASQSIGTSGGTIAITKPGDPMDGFVISVPPSSYSANRTFKVSSAPITSHTFGSDITPVSPMITVDNGGGYSENVMYVRVPVKVPDGYFAMGFIYDEKTKQLEGMPLVGMDNQSITVATRHFSSFFISMIKKAVLKKDIDSGFRPGVDDWQFPNRGSFIALGGHCEGQSLTAMWYYCTSPDGKDACLYNRYDNNGNKPATPELWMDDSRGYRFCSVIQTENRDKFTDKFWRNLGGKGWKWENNKWNWMDIPGIGDEATYNLFAYSIMATGEPQEVIIESSAEGAHAMIVYKIVGNALYIADPNYPGNTDRKIIYYSGEGKFKPYNSGANQKEIDAGQGTSFETIQYAAKSTIVPWDKIAQRWAEFKNGTIGNDKFPQYTVNVVDDNGKIVPLTDGFSTKNKMMKAAVSLPYESSIYRDGKLLPFDNDLKVELVPGNNLLGFYITGTVNNSSEYVDFKYFNVKFETDVDCKTPPADVLAKLQKSTKFICRLIDVPCTVEASGSWKRWPPGYVNSNTFIVPGNAKPLEWKDPATLKWSGNSFSYSGTVSGQPDKLTGYVCYTGNKVLISFDYEINFSDQRNKYKVSVKDVPLNDPDNGGEKLGRRYIKPGIWQYNSSGSPPPVNGFATKLEWAGHDERKVGDMLQVWDYKMTEWHWPANNNIELTLYE